MALSIIVGACIALKKMLWQWIKHRTFRSSVWRSPNWAIKAAAVHIHWNFSNERRHLLQLGVSSGTGSVGCQNNDGHQNLSSTNIISWESPKYVFYCLSRWSPNTRMCVWPCIVELAENVVVPWNKSYLESSRGNPLRSFILDRLACSHILILEPWPLGGQILYFLKYSMCKLR